MLVSFGYYIPPHKKSCCKGEAIFSEFSTQLNQRKTGRVKTNFRFIHSIYTTSHHHIVNQKGNDFLNYQSSDVAGWVKNTKKQKQISNCTSHLESFSDENIIVLESLKLL